MHSRSRAPATTGLAAAVLLTAACAPRDASTAWPAPTLDGRRPILIAHRGASGERPEHTLEADERAIAQRAVGHEPGQFTVRTRARRQTHDDCHDHARCERGDRGPERLRHLAGIRREVAEEAPLHPRHGAEREGQ
ncbi:MAG: hypothetical protein ACKORK_12210, partial [Gemmatimonadota bacterium]